MGVPEAPRATDHGDGKPARPRPTPEGRRRGSFPFGASLVLDDGASWALPLAVQAPALAALRDRMFDEQAMTGRVSLGDVIEGAYMLLCIGYDLSPEEVMTLLKDVDGQALADAILPCVLGCESNHRTYDQWVTSALLANGLDPKSIPPQHLSNVLRHLVKTGRAEEASSFISSMDAAGQRTRLMESLGIYR